ncbi:MAG: hypothetical protein KDI61_09095 [Alphaproteobacteria bacterium]|nr:hypothetical protein [Alphaproteobacteria bacterium]
MVRKDLRRVILLSLVSLSTGFMMVSITAAQAASDHFTNRDLLDFPKSERDAYLTGSILSIGHTLSLFHSKKMGQCFTDWFLEQPNTRLEEIEQAMKENPDHGPSTVLLGLPQLKCGRLLPENK